MKDFRYELEKLSPLRYKQKKQKWNLFNDKNYQDNSDTICIQSPRLFCYYIGGSRGV